MKQDPKNERKYLGLSWALLFPNICMYRIIYFEHWSLLNETLGFFLMSGFRRRYPPSSLPTGSGHPSRFAHFRDENSNNIKCNSDHSNLFSYASHVVRNIYKTGRSRISYILSLTKTVLLLWLLVLRRWNCFSPLVHIPSFVTDFSVSEPKWKWSVSNWYSDSLFFF